MSKAIDVCDPKTVTEYIQKLEPALGKVVEALRQLILSTDKEIGERVKWNSPAFFYAGEMKPFNPKEYRRDIVVLNLHRGFALLVFPTGAKVNDATGLLKGDYKDGRRLAEFLDMNDVEMKGKALQKVIKQWIKLIDK
ncbi:MAG: DUF1801 domain-containing protein [Chitinophagales bacterium]